jgi:hypothetical protein
VIIALKPFKQTIFCTYQIPSYQIFLILIVTGNKEPLYAKNPINLFDPWRKLEKIMLVVLA